MKMRKVKKMSTPKDKVNYKSAAEIRAMTTFNVRARVEEENEEKSYIVEGYAAKYEPYILFYDYDDNPVYEKFSKENFENADCSDVIFQLNHGGMVYARQKNGTLEITPDDEGLHIKADLGKTAAAREIYEAIETGMLDKMSWKFSLKADAINFDKKTNTISYTPDGIRKIYDVSVVDIPANENTEIACNARAFVNGEIEKERIRIEMEQKKAERIAALKLRLNGGKSNDD
jgi:HK97 family phage prohead protease